ncbi:Parg, partial [Symbiodinium pilosum]
NFFPHTLPFILEKAGELPDHFTDKPELKKLVQGSADYLAMPRGLVLSIMAQMFLCLIPDGDRDMPSCSFLNLLFPRQPFRQEVAKLRMFVHYFERCRLDPPKGELRIWRQVRDGKPSTSAWKASSQPLLPMQVADQGIGLEDESGRGCLHADFANRYLGGGVLVGGCVQEEIRFSICPELCAAMLVCPYMLDHEAITIVGGEQFSGYSGYGRSLEYAGDFRDPTPRDEDGTVLVAITAMDAIDFRGKAAPLRQQLEDNLLLRELEKAAVAFAPTDKAALDRWPVIATGNWGCGAFGGCVELKAILQWLAASEGSRRLLYFPYDVPLGPQLDQLASDLTKRGFKEYASAGGPVIDGVAFYDAAKAKAATTACAQLTTRLEVEWVNFRQPEGSGPGALEPREEFFSAPFQKTLALVDEQKKEEFVRGIEKNLYKFDPKTQQFPLGCLCALLQHGKDSPTTQEKVQAWLDYLLDRLVGASASIARATAAEVAEECLSVPFQRLIPLMKPVMRETLADSLGEHALPHMEEAQQKQLLEGLGAETKSPVLVERIEAIMATCTEELNLWLARAPCFPSTPLALADALARAEHPLLRFFTFARQPEKKEAFLMAVALCMQSLKTRLRWMGSAEPVLERLSHDLQQRLFYVKNQGAVMERGAEGTGPYTADPTVLAEGSTNATRSPQLLELCERHRAPVTPSRGQALNLRSQVTFQAQKRKAGFGQ